MGPTLTIIMHPSEVVGLIQDTRFIDCSAYGMTRVVRNGEIGTLMGIPIIVSHNVPEGKVFVVPEIDGIRYGDNFIERNINPSRRKQVWES